MKIIEVFSSIEGEGIRAGRLCTFIRLAGCNRRCKWCDTSYSFDNGQEMTLDEICEKIPEDMQCVTITGGEPLLQKDQVSALCNRLIRKKKNINIETNGTIDFRSFTNRSDSIIITADYKLPTSGMEDKACIKNLRYLKKKDVLKFVVGSEEDLERMKEVMEELNPECHVFISPVFGMIEPVDIVGFMQRNSRMFNKYDTRIQLQLHKIIWNPETKGV